MPKLIKTVLMVTGVLSALVLLFPSIIIIGTVFFIVPGLILMAMPTLFLYLLASALIRLLLPIKNTFLAYSIAIACAVALACLAVWPHRNAAEREFELAIQPEIIPTSPITVSGHVLFEQASDSDGRIEPVCSPLCLAMLDLDGVESVTMIRDSMAKTFALKKVDPEDKDVAASLKPYDPSQIIAMANQARDYEIEPQVKNRLAERWASRLSGPQRLVAVDRPTGAPTWHLISYTHGISRFQEIRDPQKDLVLRYQSVSQDVLAFPPYIKFKPSDSGFGIIGRGFGIAAFSLFKENSAPTAHPEDNFARALALKDYWAENTHDNESQP